LPSQVFTHLPFFSGELIKLQKCKKKIFRFFFKVSESGPNQVVLRQVTPELDGKYRCEVSADAPTFHTQIVAAWMHVVRTY